MNNKDILKEVIIVFFALVLLFMSMGITLIQTQNEEKRSSVSYDPYVTDKAPMITLTGCERDDICELAKKQAGIKEGTNYRVGLTPYHKWATTSEATQFSGEAYGSKWTSNAKYYNYWCVLFVNWCAFHAGLNCWANYPMHAVSNSTAKEWYQHPNVQRAVANVNATKEKGWVLIEGAHMDLYVDNGEWVEGNSYDTIDPPPGWRTYVSYNSRRRQGFEIYGKPYYRATVTYYLDGKKYGTDKYTEDKTDLKLPELKRDGCTFKGWYIYSDYSGTPYTWNDPAWNGNLPLYAKFVQNDKKITYVLNGGEWNGTPGKDKYTVGTVYTFPKNVKKSNGSYFDGWYEDKACNTAKPATTKDDNQDITVFARYRSNIQYQTNGGSWGGEPIRSYIEKRENSLPKNITRPTCEFMGWYYDSSFTNRVVSNGKNDVIPNYKEGTITVYAKWKANITYNSRIGFFKGETVNGDNGGPVRTTFYYPGTNAWTNPGINNGRSLLTSADVYEPWCTFGGWYTVWGCNESYGPFYNIGDVVYNGVFPGGYWPWTGEVRLYARFIGREYSIFLHCNKGETTNSSWIRTSTSEFYKKYTYRYQNNTYSLPNSKQMYRRGYEFKGWYEDEFFTGNPVTATDKNTGGDKHYYAKWKPRQYPLFLNSIRGKVKDSSYTFTDLGSYRYRYNKLYTYDTYVPLPTQPDTIDRRGHTFNGWYRETNYSGNRIYQLVPGDINTQIFYAKWTPNIYQIKLHKDGSTVINPRIDNGRVVGDDIIGTYTYARGSTFPVGTTDIKKSGAIFAGWYDQPNKSGNRVTGIRSGDDDTAPIGDKEYWARWVRPVPSTVDAPATDIKSNGDYILYLYANSKIKTDSRGNLISRQTFAASSKKRTFSIDINVDGNPGTPRPVTVWLQSKPTDSGATRLNWKMTTTSSRKSYNSSTYAYTVNDHSRVTFTCPSDVVNTYLGQNGSRKVYVHFMTEAGDRGYYAVNLVRRLTYAMH